MYSVLLLVLAFAALGMAFWTFRQWQATRSGLILFVLLPLLWKLPTIFTIRQLHPAFWQDTVRYVPSAPSVPLSLWVVFAAFALTGLGLWRREGCRRRSSGRYPLTSARRLVSPEWRGQWCTTGIDLP